MMEKKAIRGTKAGIRLIALSLLLALFLTAAASCQFPFSLDMQGEGSDPSAADAPSVSFGESEQASGTSGESTGGSSDEQTESGTDEEETDGLEFVQPSESESVGGTVNNALPETESSAGIAYDVSPIVDAVMPAMVAITVKVTNAQSGILGGSYESEGSGSGIVVAQDDTYLYIVTNNHVVANSTGISVCFVDGEEYTATVKGTNTSYDLAVILVKLADMSKKTMEDIRIAKLGSSDALRLGQGAVAIGNALGYGQSVTVGCISALGRTVKSDEGASIPLIQTDAAINPGNSGGALLNMKGEVIGINSMKYASTEVEGMGYAIPISDALPIMQALIEEKIYDESERGYLGVGCTAHTQGLYVSRVAADSPAAKAGIQKGDIITAVNGKSVKTEADLSAVLSRLTAGDTAVVRFLRKNGAAYESKEVTATLALRDDN